MMKCKLFGMSDRWIMAVLSRLLPKHTEENHQKSPIFEAVISRIEVQIITAMPVRSSPCLLPHPPYISYTLPFACIFPSKILLRPNQPPFSSHKCRVSPLLMVSHNVWRERKSDRHAPPQETPTDSLPELAQQWAAGPAQVRTDCGRVSARQSHAAVCGRPAVSSVGTIPRVATRDASLSLLWHFRHSTEIELSCPIHFTDLIDQSSSLLVLTHPRVFHLYKLSTG